MLVKLELSPGQLSKIRNGRKIRIRPEIVGSGYNLIVDPSTYNKITRAVRKNKGVDLQLSHEEIQMNKEPTEEMAQELQGQGIFGKKFDRALKKAGIKKNVYKAGDFVKPLAKAATKKAISTAVTTAVTPVAGPTAGLIAGKLAGELASGQVNKFYDRPDKFYAQFGGSGIDGDDEIPSKKIPIYKPMKYGITGGRLLDDMHPALIPQPDSAHYQFKFTTSRPVRMGGVGLYA